MSAGKVTKLPPPTTELSAPPPAPARNRIAASVAVIPGSLASARADAAVARRELVLPGWSHDEDGTGSVPQELHGDAPEREAAERPARVRPADDHVVGPGELQDLAVGDALDDV